jgi:hypothetical protein
VALTPQGRLGDTSWRPDLNAAALGIAQADYGLDASALMGVSAARHHGAIPRALAVAVVAVPRQRPALNSEIGTVYYSRRDCGRLDLERVDTELGSGWITTIEQTALDLAARPDQASLPTAEIDQALRSLALRADPALLAELAAAQHRPAALRRVNDILES